MVTLLLRANGNGSETKLSHHWLLCERARQTEQVGKKVEQQLDACLIQFELFGHCATFQFGVVAGRPRLQCLKLHRRITPVEAGSTRACEPAG